MSAKDLPCCKVTDSRDNSTCDKPAFKVWYNFDQECIVPFCEDHYECYEGHVYAAELTIYLASWIEKKRKGAFLCPGCKDPRGSFDHVTTTMGKTKYQCIACKKAYESPPGVEVVEVAPGRFDFRI